MSSFSHALQLLQEIWFMPTALFAYWKGLGCTDALQTISHHLQKSLAAGMESYLVQLNFGAAFDRMSHSGLLFKSKFIGVESRSVHLYRVHLRP